MATKRITVKQLAQEAGLDTDDVLIALWDAGYNNITGPNDRFGKQESNRARRALGLATRKELRTFTYWMKLLGIDERGFKDLLAKLDVPLKEKSHKLKQKALSKLKAEARKHGIDPITGGIVTPKDVRGKAIKISVFKWRTPGHVRDINWLDEKQVKAIHFELVNDFSSGPDPIIPPGVKSESLLGSAVFRPRTALGKTLKYPTVETSAAAMLHSLILDHPFHNGNKRTALVAMLVFLDKNGFTPDFNQDEAFKLVLQIAQHSITDFSPDNLADREVLTVAEWLCSRCRITEIGNHPIPFRKLRQILKKYDCRLSSPTGSKVTIERTISVKAIFKKTQILRNQIPYHDEGQDVGQTILKKLRKDLHLDDSHGIDSHSFYTKEPTKASDFIAWYSQTLKRLAKR